MIIEPLTKVDLAALRKADSILFHQRNEDDAKIEAIKDAPDATERNPFPTETRHTIPVDSRVHTFGRGSGATHTAFHLVSSAQYNATWSTIAAMLRAGDVLSLMWYRGNQSPVLDDAHLVRDELRLCVKRGDKHRFVFMVAVSVGLDNTARMTKIAGQP